MKLMIWKSVAATEDIGLYTLNRMAQSIPNGVNWKWNQWSGQH